MFEKRVYDERRRKLREAVGNGLILLLGNEESSINYRDTDMQLSAMQLGREGMTEAAIAGNLQSVAIGAETAMHYAGDLTRTFPVNGKFSTLQRGIYDIVLAAHQAAVQLLKPGVLFRDIHLHACERLVGGLQQLEIMKGDIRESVAAGAHALFFPCGPAGPSKSDLSSRWSRACTLTRG